MTMPSSFLICKSRGYTLVELMVALAVSSIVIAGSYAGYALLAQQQQSLNIQTSEDRNALSVIDLIQSDIRMAGYTDPNGTMQSKVVLEPISEDIDHPDQELIVVYDDYNSDNIAYRALIHYSLQQYSTTTTGSPIYKLIRDWRSCSPADECNLNSSISKYKTDPGVSNGQVILDSVLAFNCIGGKDRKSLVAITYPNEFQSIRIRLQLTSPDKIEGSAILPTKSFDFLTRVMNVSLLP